MPENLAPRPEAIVLVGYGPVGARFAEELLPLVRAGLAELTIVGAEAADAYNRVLVAEYAVGHAARDALEITDPGAARDAGVRILTGVSVVSINRTRRTVTLGDGEDLAYDRLVLATGARANVPTLAGVTRVRRDRMRPPRDPATLDSAEAPLPRGITALRDLADADAVLEAVRAGRRIVVLGAGVLGMEIALAAARGGAEVCVVHHGPTPMARNLDRGGGSVLTSAARRAGVSMVANSRAESVVYHLDDDGVERFDGLVCADGKQIRGDLLLLSCGVGARTELAQLSGLSVSMGVLVDERLSSWDDPRIFAIGDCAQIAPRQAVGASSAAPSGAPSGLVGPGWRQADWLAASFAAELGASAPLDGPPLAAERPALVLLKAEGIDVAAAGDVTMEPWDDTGSDHSGDCAAAPRRVSQWADPEHGRYVKMVTRAGVLEGFVCVGMPRTAAELTLLFERGSELPADRSVLLRFDGPDYEDAAGAFAPDATVCWCNGVTVGAISDSAAKGNDTVACIGSATRAGTGCGGCKVRIGEVLEQFARSAEPQELVP
ncbi:assimilatory nitrate reductase electron transfer subunit [Marisediminicola sp. UYEF4]|uniref:FAD-dependent oxidoreductase n=1 Tax=Marisediminicola sp. UYEF4 TaxID=1756384 RepID=UPI003394780A